MMLGVLIALTGKFTVFFLWAVLVFITSAVVLFEFSYNMLTVEPEGFYDQILLAFMALIASGIGAVIAFILTNLLTFLVPTVFMCIVCAAVVYNSLIYADVSENKSINMTATLLSGTVGFCLGRVLQHSILCFVTAALGAFSFVHGLNVYFGGLNLEEMTNADYFYSLIFVVITLSGFFHQRCVLFRIEKREIRIKYETNDSDKYRRVQDTESDTDSDTTSSDEMDDHYVSQEQV